MPQSSSESSHLDFSSDDSDDDEDVGGKIEPFLSGRDDSFSDCSDRDSDEISFVLRESARALIEDVEFRDPVVHYETSWRSNFESTVLDTLDDQLKNDPRGSWTAICWHDAAPEDVPQPSDHESSTIRPQTTRLLTSSLGVRRRVISHTCSPVTPGDPILAGTPPLSLTPKSPMPLSPAAFPSHPNPLEFAVAAPVPRYRPLSDPPPYSASVSPGTWTEFSSSATSFAGKTSSPFTSEASDADNEASTDDGMSDSRTFTERSSDFDSSSDRRSNSDPSLATTASQVASSCTSPSPSPAPSSVLLPHAYSFSAAFAKYNSSPSICGLGSTGASPMPQRVLELNTVPASTGHSPPSSSLTSPIDISSLPFPLFTTAKPSEAINFAPERPTSPPVHAPKGRSALFFHHHPKPLTGTWKAAASATRDQRAPSEDSSALQRFATRCGTLSRKLTTVAAGGVR